MGFKINYVLHDIDKIILFGENRDSMHWFALTDGLLWINVGKDTIYEYSDAAIEYWKEAHRYNDYYLSRFCEDACQKVQKLTYPEKIIKNQKFLHFSA